MNVSVAVWWTFFVESVTVTVIGKLPPCGYALAFNVPDSSPAEFNLRPLGKAALPGVLFQW